MPDIEFPNNNHGSNNGTGNVSVEEARPANFPKSSFGSEAPVPPIGEAPEVTPTVTGGQKKPSKLVVFGIGAVVLVGLFALMFHHTAKKPVAAKQPEPTQTTAAESASQSQASLPTETQDQNKQPQLNQQNTTADEVQGTRNADKNGQPLSTVQNFGQGQLDGNGQWSPAPYPGGARSVEDAKTLAALRLTQVSKPSLTFVLGTPEAANSPDAAHLATDTELPISNFGYQPGFHIITHLESVATTATKAPVIAVVDYDYRRSGVTLIPAGARVIGEIEQATSTGIVGIHFTTVHLPDGEDIPINAVGLDQRMGPLKGAVTGRNRGKQFLLAALSGIGSTAAMAVGNNINGAYSESDMIRGQVAQNIGTATDMQVQQLAVSEHLVVSVPAGTQVQVTFVSPSKKKDASQGNN